METCRYPTAETFWVLPPSFQVLRNTYHRTFGEFIFFLDFSLAISTCEITGGPDGNRINGGCFLQNKAAWSAYDVHSLALPGFFDESPQVSLCVAEAKSL